MNITPTQIREVMRELGKRKKTMSEAALAQRKAAAKQSAIARKTKKEQPQ